MKNTDRNPRSWFFFLLSPILFFMPFVYLNELDAVFVDKTVHYYAWRRFIGVLRRDWDNAITPVSYFRQVGALYLTATTIRLPCCFRQMLDSWPSKASTAPAAQGTGARHRLQVTSPPYSVFSSTSFAKFSLGAIAIIGMNKRSVR